MTTDLITQLTALLKHWNTTVADAMQGVAIATDPVRGAYYSGVLDGMKAACDELAAVLAIVMAAQTTDNH